MPSYSRDLRQALYKSRQLAASENDQGLVVELDRIANECGLTTDHYSKTFVTGPYRKQLKLILVGGFAGVGKDTFARFLMRGLTKSGVKVAILALANPLKDLYARLAGAGGWGSDFEEHKESHRDGLKDLSETKIKPIFGRHCWATALLEGLPEDLDYVIVPDVRYPEELETFQRSGLLVASVWIHGQATTRDCGQCIEPKSFNHVLNSSRDATIDLLCWNRLAEKLVQHPSHWRTQGELKHEPKQS